MRGTDNGVDERLKNCRMKLYHSLVFLKVRSYISGSGPKSCVSYDFESLHGSCDYTITIFHIFHKIFTFVLYLYTKTINLSIKNNALYPLIIDNTKYFLYF